MDKQWLEQEEKQLVRDTHTVLCLLLIGGRTRMCVLCGVQQNDKISVCATFLSSWSYKVFLH